MFLSSSSNYFNTSLTEVFIENTTDLLRQHVAFGYIRLAKHLLGSLHTKGKYGYMDRSGFEKLYT